MQVIVATRVAAGGALTRPRGAPRAPAHRRLRPTRTASLVLEAAVRALPAVHRDRYRREFGAELVGMPPTRQLGYAVALLVHSTALAVALSGQEPGRHDAGRWRCRVHLHHDVARPVAGIGRPGVAACRQCTRCGRVAPTPASGPPALGSGTAAPDAG